MSVLIQIYFHNEVTELSVEQNLRCSAVFKNTRVLIYHLFPPCHSDKDFQSSHPFYFPCHTLNVRNQNVILTDLTHTHLLKWLILLLLVLKINQK